MDPNERKRKAPPLPRFQEPLARDPNVVQKVTDFLQQISKEASSDAKAQKPAIPLSAPVEEKKKFSLASLNSKLNSIMSTKKIDLNKVVQSSKKAEQTQQKQRRDIEIQYDPSHPNSYEQSKSHYLEMFQKIKKVKRSPLDSENEKMSKMIADYQKDGVQISEETTYQSSVAQSSKLDERQNLALRMMQKQGFRVGQGLGKKSQGIRTPLTIKKMTDSSCKIQLSAISLTNFVSIEQSAQNALLAFKIQKSPVIALKVDMMLKQLTDEMQLEIKEECKKYGDVLDWVALSITDGMIFFCRYATVQETFRSFTRINGRFYDEKPINVFFYPEDLFLGKNFVQPLHQPIQF